MSTKALNRHISLESILKDLDYCREDLERRDRVLGSGTASAKERRVALGGRWSDAAGIAIGESYLVSIGHPGQYDCRGWFRRAAEYALEDAVEETSTWKRVIPALGTEVGWAEAAVIGGCMDLIPRFPIRFIPLPSTKRLTVPDGYGQYLRAVALGDERYQETCIESLETATKGPGIDVAHAQYRFSPKVLARILRSIRDCKAEAFRRHINELLKWHDEVARPEKGLKGYTDPPLLISTTAAAALILAMRVGLDVEVDNGYVPRVLWEQRDLADRETGREAVVARVRPE